MSQTYLTREGLKKIKEEYQYLVDVERKECAKRIKAAIDQGGYEDNLMYDIELEKQLQVERRISDLDEILRGSNIISEKNVRQGFVTIGSLVVVEVEGEKDQFKIVGSVEADPLKNLISNESPVGQSLLGAKVGDVVEVTTPVVKLIYKILEIKND